MSTATGPTEAAFARAAAYSAYSMDVTKAQSGLTAREHAAIALRVPDSGNDWLDAMIRTAQRNEWAARAHVPWNAVADTYAQASGRRPTVEEAGKYCADIRFAFADAMLSASAAHSAEGD